MYRLGINCVLVTIMNNYVINIVNELEELILEELTEEFEFVGDIADRVLAIPECPKDDGYVSVFSIASALGKLAMNGKVESITHERNKADGTEYVNKYWLWKYKKKEK